MRENIDLCVVSPRCLIGTSVTGGCVSIASSCSCRVELENIIELPLAYELSPVRIASRCNSAESFDHNRNVSIVSGWVDEDKTTVHLGDVGKLGHNDSGDNTCLGMLAIENDALDASSCTVAVVSARVATPILLS